MAEDINNQYVVGIIFNETRERVMLTRKTHPEWQAGRLNGIGGHIEENEWRINAMIRETREECKGMEFRDWNEFLHLGGNWGDVYFFYVTVSDDVFDYIFYNVKVNDTGEPFEQWWIKNLQLLPASDIITNMQWIIPLAKYCADNRHTHNRYGVINAMEQG